MDVLSRSTNTSPIVTRPAGGSTGWSRLPSGIVLAMLLVLCLGAGVAGAVSTSRSLGDWYPTLRKPAWTPPEWVFGPVWTALYICMAVAAWLVWKRRGPGRGSALVLFGTQLGFNAAWSPLFFGLHQPGLALLDIVLLWLTLVGCVAAFRSVSVPAAVLLMPYLAWVSFAAVLNGAIWRMNP